MLCIICGRAGTDPKRVSRLGGVKVEIAGMLISSSDLSDPVSNSSTSNSSTRSWKTQLIQACHSIPSKFILSVVNLA